MSSEPTTKYPPESFCIPGEEGISEVWRRNKSSVVALELAHLLASLRKLVGYLGMNTGTIIWEGMRPPEESAVIVLDPSIVRGKYPIPAARTDHVVGIAVREAYRRIEWGEKAKALAWGKIGFIEAAERRKFELFLEMAERIYLDRVSRRTVLGLYTDLARSRDFATAREQFPPPPSVTELLHYWWLCAPAGDDEAPKSQSASAFDALPLSAAQRRIYEETLSSLNARVHEGFGAFTSGCSILERCDRRSELYTDIWRSIRATVQMWPADAHDLPAACSISLPKSSCSAPRISDSTLKAIEAALAENVDLTYEVRLIYEEDIRTVTVKTSTMILPMEEKLDRRLYNRLKACLRLRCRTRGLISRGLKAGSIDRRRLYRAPITGQIFMDVKDRFELDYDIALLIDASSSMVGPKWKSAQRAFLALYEALKELDEGVRIFAYNEAFDVCYLTELSRGKRLYTVVPRGKTASGEAIVATALLLKKRKRLRKSLMVHITDGASNWGSDVRNAIDYCKKEKIGLLTLGVGCSTSSQADLVKEFGRLVRFVDDIDSLPRKFTELISRAAQMG